LQNEQEINFDQLFEKSEAPKESTENLETLQLTKVSKSFPKTSKLSLSNFGDESSFSKSATSSLQSSLQSDLIASATEKKLAEMSLNLRNSIPRERLDETGSFRKNKTFEFSLGNKPANDFGGVKDFGSTLPQITELTPSGQTEEVTLEIPSLKIKKKPQSTSTGDSKKAGKGRPKFANLEIQSEENTEEPQSIKIENEKVEEKEIKTETHVEEPKNEEEKKEPEEFVLEKPFPKAGDLKRKNKKNLAIVSEDNEEQAVSSKAKKGFGLSIDTSENEPTEKDQPSQVEQVEKEKENEKVEVKEEIKEEQKEVEIEPVLPKPKPKGKGLGMGKKKFGMAIELDIDAINQEFTFGGEKGQKHYDENDLAQIMEIAMKEVYRLAKECVDHMSKENIL